jgi:tRNA (guanine-N7-)-methyltransferase
LRIRGKEKVPGLLAAAHAILHDPANGMLTWSQDCPAYLEVGCGRGTFLTTCAARQPEAKFIGLDKYTPIVARAASLALERGLTNVRILDLDVERALTVFETGAFDAIFLNFSDPWPRRRNDRKRLTHPRLLTIMAQLLRDGGVLEQKSDNAEFFEWSEEQLRVSGWRITSVTHNLPAKAPEGDETLPRYVQTEYEERFRALGIPIHHLSALPPNPA